MKRLKTLLILLFTFSFFNVDSQNITADTTLANKHIETAKEYFKNKSYDSAIVNFAKASVLYEKSEQWRKYMLSETKHGECLQKQWQFDQAAATLDNAVKKTLLHINENDSIVAEAYYFLGLQYYYQSKNNSTLLYWKKSLKIRKEIFGDKHVHVANSINNIGLVYAILNEYDLALQYFIKALLIRKDLFEEKHIFVANNYNNIGLVYFYKSEYNLALQYFIKALQIKKELLGENHNDLNAMYNNIGIIYWKKDEYDLALKNYFKSLQLEKKIFGEKHADIANKYNNIGLVYLSKNEYDSALQYYFKSLEIKKELLGEKHNHVATIYNNIGLVYVNKNEYDSALYYYFKSLEIKKEVFGKKHNDIAVRYNNIGSVFEDKNEYDSAIRYYHKGIVAGLRNFNDIVNIYSVPIIRDYLSWNDLIKSMAAKAEIFADTCKHLTDFDNLSDLKRLKIALRHYQACDTLISQVRKNMKTKSDKIALGTFASVVYEGAVGVCLDLANATETDLRLSIRESAFYFSEKNKSSVLLESLAGAEAQKFSGIPDTLLKQEHKLQIDIAVYKKNIAESKDSLTEIRFQGKLFKANRSYDSLIMVFENNYPKYYELKYNQKPATVYQISNLLDKKTAIISYFTGDSTIIIFTVLKKKFYVTTIIKPSDFEEKIENLRYNISNTDLLAGEYKTNTNTSVDEYQKNAFELYQILFPQELKDVISKKTENLIIIPDEKLATVPFEALLTERYNSTWTDWKNKTYFSEMPYLVKDYNISYSYSANLFFKTFNKSVKQKSIELTEMNDWIAFAPVFDNENISGTAMRTRKLLEKIVKTDSDSIKTRAFTRDGMYISELPGSLIETQSIFKLFEEQDKKALLKTHLKANEEFIKSEELSKYKYIHFATHGIVNEEKPELSGLILAQDTTSSEDNILFTGEIYNMKLNADLTVMSACETGLGKITEGEGVIGLTRALLYAGSKNIIVSLWQVSDNSTNDLMVEFYKKMLLKKKKTVSYSEPLRKAKLKLIEEGKYAHPFFWSPFILIGK